MSCNIPFTYPKYMSHRSDSYLFSLLKNMILLCIDVYFLTSAYFYHSSRTATIRCHKYFVSIFPLYNCYFLFYITCSIPRSILSTLTSFKLLKRLYIILPIIKKFNSFNYIYSIRLYSKESIEINKAFWGQSSSKSQYDWQSMSKFLIKQRNEINLIYFGMISFAQLWNIFHNLVFKLSKLVFKMSITDGNLHNLFKFLKVYLYRKDFLKDKSILFKVLSDTGV